MNDFFCRGNLTLIIIEFLQGKMIHYHSKSPNNGHVCEQQVGQIDLLNTVSEKTLPSGVYNYNLRVGKFPMRYTCITPLLTVGEAGLLVVGAKKKSKHKCCIR